MPTSPADAAMVKAYHQRTKHRFEAYAAGPSALDWDAQPAAFRHFDGAPQVALPHLAAIASGSALQGALVRPLHEVTAAPPPVAVALDAAGIGAWLQLALGITAWKSHGPDRWAVRANPSSGNLHPVEAYLLVGGIAGLADGLYHYRPECHALELRAAHPPHPGDVPLLAVVLGTVMWREAWKYGERAFRYCQLDVGHATAALRYAAVALGWSLAEQPQFGGATLAALCGMDRAADFPVRRYPEVEREEAELMLAVVPASAASPSADVMSIAGLHARVAAAEWHGSASAIDRHPMFRWPLIREVAAATRGDDGAVPPAPTFGPVPAPVSGAAAAAIPVHVLITLRRSAQRFDHRHVMPLAAFAAIVGRLHLLVEAPHLALVFFVQRVDGLAPGLYLLAREPAQQAALRGRLDPGFEWTPVPAIAGLVRLLAVAPVELQRLTRSLHCHQDIAANSCFALGMLSEFAALVERDAAAYRRLYRDCGAIGQALYLEAEAQGLRGTGIGCFFDDPVHRVLGLDGDDWQSLYHFTVGRPIDDGRIETTPAYGDGQDRENP